MCRTSLSERRDILKRSPRRFLNELLLNDDFDLQHKLQNMLITISLIGCIATVIISLFIGISVVGNILNLVTAAVLFLTFFISVIKKQKKAASYLITIAISTILFPLLFMFNGGIYSGMPIWLTFGLIYPWMILEGKGCYIMFGINLAVALSCFVIQVFFPGLVFEPAKDSTVFIAVDMAQVLILVPIIVGTAIKYHNAAYEQQRLKNEIQEKKLLEAMKAADRANEAKTSFLANMSHEIRTPINAVLGMDEMIIRESRDENILSYAESIQSAGQSLLSVVNDVLDFSKIENGKLELIPSEYSVQELMKDCWNMIIMRAEKKNLLLEIRNSPDLPSVLKGDEARIRQIMLNLLTNAVKYTSAGSVIMTLSFTQTSAKEIMLRISVRDTGMGISKENQKNLFRSFRRLDEHTNRNIEGTGLGLSITKQLTKQMNGTITVHSTLGSGSEFIVEIPQEVISEQPVGAFNENRGQTPDQKPKYRERFQAPDAKVLVVDDVKLNTDVLRGLLKKTKVQIDTAYSGRECLGLVRKNTYDIIFMDHLMPEMDGVETLKIIKKIPDSPNSSTPIIALTANAMLGAKEKYESYGFNDYLAKPVQGDELELMLLKYLPKSLIRTRPAEPSDDNRNNSFSNPELPELDPAAGLEYCCGDEELYIRMLSMLELDAKLKRLENAFHEADWKSYERLCCALKSTAKTIGASRLSAAAEQMEQSTRSGRIAEIRTLHSGFVAVGSSLNKAAEKYITSNTNSEGEKY